MLTVGAGQGNLNMSNSRPSILFKRSEDFTYEHQPDEPDFFVDLNLNKIIANITGDKDEYNLKPFFYFPLDRIDAIQYRHEVMKDLENPNFLANIKSFTQKLRVMRGHLVQADGLYYTHQKDAWFLDAVEIYCDAVKGFLDDMSSAAIKSLGFQEIKEYLLNYVHSSKFTLLVEETQKIKADLAGIRYYVLIKGDSLKVFTYDSESDYSMDVEETFKKFKQEPVINYKVTFPTLSGMNHVEAKILDFVAKLYPEIFSNLDSYREKNGNFLDEVISTFDREIQFYISYLDHIAILKLAGLKFCYPTLSNSSKEISSKEGYDLALAHKLNRLGSTIVCNDFYLRDKERIIVVTGPNQGGKTTFARTFGQLHYLAALGCPVPGKEARLFLFDRLFAHFEKEENIKNLRGKLQDDLVRIHDILKKSTPNSVLIINEIFTSTTLQDAVSLSQKVMEEITAIDLLCVWVTFIDELASFSAQTVSMMSTVVSENPALRTFRILRRPADGLSYAMSIVEKYRLTYGQLRERVRS
jgi:DNA mismatch repair protein MutS